MWISNDYQKCVDSFQNELYEVILPTLPKRQRSKYPSCVEVAAKMAIFGGLEAAAAGAVALVTGNQDFLLLGEKLAAATGGVYGLLEMAPPFYRNTVGRLVANVNGRMALRRLFPLYAKLMVEGKLGEGLLVP